MKNTTSLLMAALAALSISSIGSASAEVIYITGSTAFRSSANTAIKSFATSNGGGLLAVDNATLGSAGNLLLNYTNASGTNLIDVHWSGSESGIQSVAGPTNGTNAATIGFFATNATGTNSSGGNSTSAQNTNNHVANLTFSDTFQSTSVFNGSFQGVTYAALSDAQVGVVSFNWIGSKNFPATNVPANLAQTILANGQLTLEALSGNSADATNVAYLIGRNIDSGTRLTTLAETGYGVKTQVVQYAVGTGYTTNANGTVTITGTSTTNTILAYPIETINKVSSASVGNSGYSSGGTLCGFMTNVYSPSLTYIDISGATNTSAYTGNYLIGYAGTSDANGQVANGLVKLNYAGVPCSTTAIAVGQYTFWGYEHLLNATTASTAAKAVASSLTTLLLATPTATLTPNVNLNDMQCARNVDGGNVIPLY